MLGPETSTPGIHEVRVGLHRDARLVGNQVGLDERSHLPVVPSSSDVQRADIGMNMGRRQIGGHPGVLRLPPFQSIEVAEPGPGRRVGCSLRNQEKKHAALGLIPMISSGVKKDVKELWGNIDVCLTR